MSAGDRLSSHPSRSGGVPIHAGWRRDGFFFPRLQSVTLLEILRYVCMYVHTYHRDPMQASIDAAGALLSERPLSLHSHRHRQPYRVATTIQFMLVSFGPAAPHPTQPASLRCTELYIHAPELQRRSVLQVTWFTLLANIVFASAT
jgi:hypothetical protein